MDEGNTKTPRKDFYAPQVSSRSFPAATLVQPVGVMCSQVNPSIPPIRQARGALRGGGGCGGFGDPASGDEG